MILGRYHLSMAANMVESINSHGTPEMAQQGLPCPHQRRDLRALRRLKVVRYGLLPGQRHQRLKRIPEQKRSSNGKT